MNKLGPTNAFLTSLRAFLHSHIRSERGATAVEYGLLIALIAAVIITAVVLLGGNVKQGFDTVNTNF